MKQINDWHHSCRAGGLWTVQNCKVDQTAQKVRFKGDFDRNFLVNLGASFRYQF
jgi:hypothetical protein